MIISFLTWNSVMYNRLKTTILRFIVLSVASIELIKYVHCVSLSHSYSFQINAIYIRPIEFCTDICIFTCKQTYSQISSKNTWTFRNHPYVQNIIQNLHLVQVIFCGLYVVCCSPCVISRFHSCLTFLEPRILRFNGLLSFIM